MGGLNMNVLIIILILVVLFVIPNVIIVPQAREYVIERLGSYLTTWQNGLHFKIPFIDRISNKVTLKEIVKDFAPQPVITKDNVIISISSLNLYFPPIKLKIAIKYGIANFKKFLSFVIFIPSFILNDTICYYSKLSNIVSFVKKHILLQNTCVFVW